MPLVIVYYRLIRKKKKYHHTLSPIKIRGFGYVDQAYAMLKFAEMMHYKNVVIEYFEIVI